MRTATFASLTLLTLILPVRGADTPEFDKLQASYKAAVEKATNPLTQTYVKELERLRDVQTRAAKLESATAVQAEIDGVSDPGASSPASAATTAKVPELDKLRASYDVAIERATKPLTQTYLAELGKLRDTYTRATNLEAAQAVQAAMDATYQSIAIAKSGKGTLIASQNSPTDPKATADPRSTKVPPPNPKWIEGKTWATAAGNTLEFSKGGRGVRTTKSGQTPFKWRILSTGFVQVDGEARPPDPAFTLFVQFTSESEGSFGNVKIQVR